MSFAAEGAMAPLDRFVNAVRRLVEDRLPWFDRKEQEAKEAHSDDLHQQAIVARVDSEHERDRLASYRRVGQRR